MAQDYVDAARAAFYGSTNKLLWEHLPHEKALLSYLRAILSAQKAESPENALEALSRSWVAGLSEEARPYFTPDRAQEISNLARLGGVLPEEARQAAIQKFNAWEGSIPPRVGESLADFMQRRAFGRILENPPPVRTAEMELEPDRLLVDCSFDCDPERPLDDAKAAYLLRLYYAGYEMEACGAHCLKLDCQKNGFWTFIWTVYPAGEFLPHFSLTSTRGSAPRS